MVFCWQQYLAQRRDPGAEPLHAATLRGLPPATILSCEYDPLRDEAEQYAQRMREAGVPVRCERLPGMVHACIHMLGLTRRRGGCSSWLASKSPALRNAGQLSLTGIFIHPLGVLCRNCRKPLAFL